MKELTLLAALAPNGAIASTKKACAECKGLGIYEEVHYGGLTTYGPRTCLWCNGTGIVLRPDGYKPTGIDDMTYLSHVEIVTRGRAVIQDATMFGALLVSQWPYGGRINVVIDPTKSAEEARKFGSTDNARYVPNLETALYAYESPVVIGGPELFAAALPRATNLLLTFLSAEPDGDVQFPWYPGATEATHKVIHCAPHLPVTLYGAKFQCTATDDHDHLRVRTRWTRAE